MLRFLKIAIPVFVVGFIAGNAFWYLASPLWIDRVVSEELPADLRLTQVSSAQFVDADAAHRGKGNAALLKSDTGSILLRLTEFEVTNGPDLKVYLSSSKNPTRASDVLDAEWHSLGPLKGNIGDQTYVLPADLDVSQYGSVVIWCEQFSVLFAHADLVDG
ncbi:MAG: hypothetical protein ACI861_002525 [Paracoccaceae bacterium]|jgi:hypothetical protein